MEENYRSLWDFIDSMTDHELCTDFDFSKDDKKKEAHWKRDRNLRDVLTHLYEWQILLIKWVSSNQKGDKKPFLPKPYNWKTYGQMNLVIFDKHQKTSLEEAKTLLEGSHQKVLHLLHSFSNEELFTKALLPWTGNATLGSFFISNSSSHYNWALKKLKAHRKNLSKQA